MQLLKIYTKQEEEKLVKKVSNVFAIIAITIVSLSLSWHFGKDKFKDKYVDESTYPVNASDYILNNIDLKTARFYNEYNYGSYLLFRGIPVFIDSRADLYAPEFSGKEEDIFMDFIDTSSIGKFYDKTFNKYNMTHVITYKNSKVNMIITETKNSKYVEKYQDEYFVIYEIKRD